MNSTIRKTQFDKTADKLIVNAPAKVNLYLMIAGKRPDGYHNIDTLMSKITWYDQVVIEKTCNPGIELKCAGSCWAPENSDNLIIKAAKALQDATGFEPCAKITLIKNIPAGTGLGSASSDAAAALLGLNEYFGLNLGARKLCEIAAVFGSDTAFFTGAAMAVCTGRGEILTGLGSRYEFEALVIVPPITIPTVDVYKKYRHNCQIYTDNKAKIAPLMDKGDIASAAGLGINMLAESCFDVNPKMREIYEKLNEILSGRVVLSGSGSAFYAILGSQTLNNIDEKISVIENSLGCKTVLVSNNRW